MKVAKKTTLARGFVGTLVASSFSNSHGITELHFGAANEEAYFDL